MHRLGGPPLRTLEPDTRVRRGAVRWLEVDTGLEDDARMSRILRQFGNAGLGALVRTWLFIARRGARPGSAVDASGDPFDLPQLAKRAGTSVPYFRKLMEFAAKVGHIDRDLWEAKGVVHFPALARRSEKYHDAKSSGQRMAELRSRRFERISDRDGSRCCRCSSVDTLELERKVPETEGGGSEDANLQIVCTPCGRKRRAGRQAKGRQDVTDQVTLNVTGRDVPVDLSVPPEITSTDRGSVKDPHTPIARAREIAIPDPVAAPLPLVGEARRPKVSPMLAPFTAGTLPRDHLRCLAPCGAVCYPHALAEEHARALQMPDKEAAIDRVRAFRDQVLGGLAHGQVIGDRPYDFWRAHWAAAHPSAAPRVMRSGPDASAGRVPATAEKLDKYDQLVRRDANAPQRKHTR